MTFLPKDYKVPKAVSGYMKFEQGENKFRILASPIIGWEGWVTYKDDQGKDARKPIRKTKQESFQVDEVDDPEKIRHFWAMPVWNYQEKIVQILEITQRTIQKTINSLSRSKDWGDPINYDISVFRKGETMQDTEYTVVPSPPKEVGPEVLKAFKEKPIRLEALYDGEDPFEVKDEKNNKKGSS